MPELVLSSSSMSCYQDCSWRFFLEYVETRPRETSVEAAVGSAVHAGIERYYELRLAGHDHEDIVESAMPQEQLELTWALELPNVLHPNKPTEKMVKVAGRVLTSYIEDVGRIVEPVAVEYGGRAIINGIEWSYHIDLIDRGRRGMRIRDTKVKGGKPRDPGVYLNQLGSYALCYRAEFGEIEEDIGLDVMVRLTRDRPYHVPYWYGGPVSDRDAGVFARQLEEVATGIAKEIYEPNGLEANRCRWCPVREQCDYWQEYVTATQGGSSAVTNEKD